MEYETHSKELHWMGWLGGMALGALAMYLADPSEGRRRRALIRDQVNSAGHKTSKMMGQTMRDARNRLSGLQAEAMRLLTPQDAKPIDDHVLEARVRSRLGRAMPHLPHMDVRAQRGVVTLMGDVVEEDWPELLQLVQAIPGVEKVWHQSRSYLMRSARMPESFSMRGLLWTAGALVAGWLAWQALDDKEKNQDEEAAYDEPVNLAQAAAENLQQMQTSAGTKQPERNAEAEPSPPATTGGSVLH